ncbi:MAG: glucosamine-6-phosphate deaminase [Candidatus Izemoplasmataceae bacterium]
MKIIKLKTQLDVSKYVANEIIHQVKNNPKSVLGLATGSTPHQAYQLIKEDYKLNNRDYSQVVTFNLDEYIGVDFDGPNSYQTYMKNALFDTLNIPKENQFFPLVDNADHYDDLIKKHGGIDLQLLGVGINGHIAFNEPLSPFNSLTRIVELAESTRIRNSKYFNSIEEVPTHAVSMGIASIMHAKRIILAVTGKSKQLIIKRFLEEPINEALPVSILKTHPNITLIIDEEAGEYISA